MSTNKAKVLREMLTGKVLSFLMEAHDGVSAKIVEAVGFRGIWASGLSISTSLGLRDCSEVSWTEVVRTVEYMSDVTSIPILLDGDSGYGNFNVVRKLVRRLCLVDVAGVCIEDALFPKQNSFLGEEHALVSVSEFCGKIRAAKDTQSKSEFCVVARTEALVSNRSMTEALDRAHAYLDAGADAILIHSKRRNADEVLEFCRRWNGAGPIVVVPTKYYMTPTAHFRSAEISMVIWANHSLRAATKSIREICRSIYERESVAQIEHQIDSLDELFEFMNYNEYLEAERRYGVSSREPRVPSIEGTKSVEEISLPKVADGTSK